MASINNLVTYKDLLERALKFGMWVSPGHNGIVYHKKIIKTKIYWVISGLDKQLGMPASAADSYLWFMVNDLNGDRIPSIPVLFSNRYLKMRGWLEEDLIDLPTVIAGEFFEEHEMERKPESFPNKHYKNPPRIIPSKKILQSSYFIVENLEEKENLFIKSEKDLQTRLTINKLVL